MSVSVGWIVMTTRLKAQSVTTVRAAAKKAGIKEDYIRDTQDWNAFKRAMRMLIKSGKADAVLDSGDGVMRDKFKDDEEVIRIQLSARHLKDKGVQYKKAEVISFYKNSGKVECGDRNIRKEVENLLKQARMIQSTTDIHKIVERLCEDSFRRVRLRDGVFFIPKGQDEIMRQMEVFYTELEGRWWSKPVGQTENEKKNVIESIVDDMNDSVDELVERMQAVKSGDKGTHGITSLIARNGMKTLQTKLEQYRKMAAAVQINVDRLLKKAGRAGDILALSAKGTHNLVAMAHQGRKVDPLLLSMAKAASHEEHPGSPVKAIRRSVALVSSKRGKGNVVAMPQRRVMALPAAK